MAITSFVTGISGVVFGWVPFVFVIAAAAADRRNRVRRARDCNAAGRHDGYGRGFAVTGLVLAPCALAVCVGGFFFTKAVVHEFRDFVDPGPHELFVDQPCTIDGDTATLQRHDSESRRSRARLPPLRRLHQQRLTSTKLSTIGVADVGPGETVPWSSSADIRREHRRAARSRDVFGPVPFDIDQAELITGSRPLPRSSSRTSSNRGHRPAATRREDRLRRDGRVRAPSPDRRVLRSTSGERWRSWCGRPPACRAPGRCVPRSARRPTTSPRRAPGRLGRPTTL